MVACNFETFLLHRCLKAVTAGEATESTDTLLHSCLEREHGRDELHTREFVEDVVDLQFVDRNEDPVC